MKNKGSILIFTLWVLIILAILSIALSRRASSDISLSRRESRSIKATYFAKAGIFKMLAELTKDTDTYNSLNGDWNRNEENPKELMLGSDTVLYGASDEGARLNLNAIDLKIEQLVALGIDERIAEAIVEYKKRKGDKGFEFMEELFLVEGMMRETFSAIEESVTVYRKNNPKININTSGERVLAAVIGDEGLVGDVLEYRRGPDGENATDDDGIFRDASDITVNIQGLNPALFIVKSDIFRIWAKAISSDNEEIFKRAEAVIDRQSGKIYHWKED